MTIRSHAASVVLAGACFAAGVAWADAGAHRVVTPNDLKWQDAASLPRGAKIAVIEGNPNAQGPVSLRIKLPANYRIPAHYHDTQEHSTILSGTLYIGMGDKFDAQKAQPVTPGTVVVMAPKMRHFAWTKEETIFQLNVMGPWTVTYVNPADDPRKK
jgi:quercetin dioxygenase-like cupin family protein